jgi:hypothetical protein
MSGHYRNTSELTAVLEVEIKVLTSLLTTDCTKIPGMNYNLKKKYHNTKERWVEHQDRMQIQ